MSKLWLTLITQERENDIEELTRDTYDFFDGIVAVVNQPSKDKTEEILNSRKKEGKIITRPFVPHHAHLMNEFLFAGVIKNLDWFLIVDSPERINLEWLKRMREDITYYEKNNVGGIFLDRIYLARYIDSMEFRGGAHWGLFPYLGQVLNYSSVNGYNKESYIINKRNRFTSAILNPAKYWYCYGSNSQTELLYRSFGDDVWMQHEQLRMRFRLFCQKELKLDFTLQSLILYLQMHLNNYPPFFEDVLETEIHLKDLFRIYGLKQSFQDLIDNRFNWSYERWKQTGAVQQGKNDGYIGVFNHYKMQKGDPTE